VTEIKFCVKLCVSSEKLNRALITVESFSARLHSLSPR
jgi:hypothetical protein